MIFIKSSIVDKKLSRISLALTFSLIVFFISFADAIMSYVSPIFIREQVANTFLSLLAGKAAIPP